MWENLWFPLNMLRVSSTEIPVDYISKKSIFDDWYLQSFENIGTSILQNTIKSPKPSSIKFPKIKIKEK